MPLRIFTFHSPILFFSLNSFFCWDSFFCLSSFLVEFIFFVGIRFFCLDSFFHFKNESRTGTFEIIFPCERCEGYVVWISFGYIADASPIHREYIADTSRIHHKYIADASFGYSSLSRREFIVHFTAASSKQSAMKPSLIRLRKLRRYRFSQGTNPARSFFKMNCHALTHINLNKK